MQTVSQYFIQQSTSNVFPYTFWHFSWEMPHGSSLFSKSSDSKFYFVSRYGSQQKSPFCKAPRGMLPFSYSNRRTKAGLSKDNGGLIRTKQRFGGRTKLRAGWESLSCRTAELILICDTEMGKTDKHPQLMRTQPPPPPPSPSHTPPWVCASEPDSKRNGYKETKYNYGVKGDHCLRWRTQTCTSNKFSILRQIVYLYLWHHSQEKTNKTRTARQCKVNDSCGEWAAPTGAERGNLPAVDWEEWQ